MHLQIHLFSPFTLIVGDRPVPDSAWSGHLPRTLLQFLAVRPNTAASTDELLDSFWAHLSPDRGRQNLYVAVNRLRQVLAAHAPPGVAGPDLVLSTSTGYRLPESTWVDYHALRQVAAEARRLRQQPPDQVLARLSALVRPRPESLLSDHTYADWAIGAREQARQDYMTLELLQGDMLARLGDWPAALEAYTTVFEMDPVQESVARQVMSTSVELGDIPGALRLFDRLRRALSEELGVDPVPETLALHAQILQAEGRQAAPPAERSPLLRDDQPATYLAVQPDGESPDWSARLLPLVERHGGWVETGEESGLLAGFPYTRDALQAALAIQQAAAEFGLPLRVAIHAAGSGGSAEGQRSVALAEIGQRGLILLSGPAAERAREVLPPGCSLQPLGLHRLLDLYGSETVTALLHPDLPTAQSPLRSLGALPNNLPVQLTSFIGRRREISAVARLLTEQRLVTLTGPGGIGKTRLALQTAARLLPSVPGGVWLVELAAVSEPNLVPQVVASALGLTGEPGADPYQAVTARLREQEAMLVLDNCEHLTQACDALARRLLQTCPGLRILATSRERLGTPGEQLWSVPPLSLPDRATQSASALRQAEASRLFLERALARLPVLVVDEESAGLIAQICHRLDGIPLAIELAAARVRIISLREIASRLDDRFRILTGGESPSSRHQTLRAAVDWSHDLLSAKERVLWRRLAVFAGGVSLEAVEAICPGDPIDPGELIDLIASLVDKSILQTDRLGPETRYRLLETIRQYGVERLSASGEESAVRGRHRDWYMGWIERTDSALAEATDEVQWLGRIEREHDNLRAALQWSRWEENQTAALRTAGALARFWERRGYWAEGLSWLKPALEAEGVDPAIRARALNAAGPLARHLGDFDLGRRCLEETIRAARATGDHLLLARALNNLGASLADRGEPAAAEPLYLESLSYLQALGLRRAQAVVLNNLGTVQNKLDQFENAIRYHEQSLAISRELGDQSNLALTLNNLGAAAIRLGDFPKAETLLKESEELNRTLGDEGGLALALSNQALLELNRGGISEAEDLLRQSLSLRRRLGDKHGMADSVGLLALTAAASGRFKRAAVLLEASEELHRALQAAVNPFVRPERERCLAELRTNLSPSSWAAARAVGRKLSPQSAVSLALNDQDPIL